MRLKSVSALCIGLVFPIALGSLVWSAPAIQTPAVTYAFFNSDLQGAPCGSQFLDVRTVGNQTRIKFLNHALMVSEDSRLTGQSVVEGELIIHNVSGHLQVHGSFVLTPFAHAGTWQADFNIHIPGNKTIDVNGLMIVKDSQMNARGTGVFEGVWFLFEHGFPVTPPPYDIPVDDPDGPGGCDFEGEVWAGRILDPNAV